LVVVLGHELVAEEWVFERVLGVDALRLHLEVRLEVVEEVLGMLVMGDLEGLLPQHLGLGRHIELLEEDVLEPPSRVVSFALL